jgi:SNF2 family DNA or RNA helicase
MKSVADASKKVQRERYGCILAHCMGLGKTFTIISFVTTLMINPIIRAINDPEDFSDKKIEGKEESTSSSQVKVDIKETSHIASTSAEGGLNKRLIYRILVLSPVNALMNWEKEFRKWTPKELLPMMNVKAITANMSSNKNANVLNHLRNWYKEGGVIIFGYELFRMLTDDSKKHSSKVKFAEQRKYLLNPGPDIVVADEAHIIKNDKSKISEIISQIRTKRRIALTGTPLQNHLEEYWCMVEWVKERYLYSKKEYAKLFIRPIKLGEAKDAPSQAVQQMKKRSHALHQRLTSIVHRIDQSELVKCINKREFIIGIRLTKFQRYLYKLFLSKIQERKKSLFRSYQTLMRVWNHPLCVVAHACNVEHASKRGLTSSRRVLPWKYLANRLLKTYQYFRSISIETMEEIERVANHMESKMFKEKEIHTITSTTLLSSSAVGKKVKKSMKLKTTNKKKKVTGVTIAARTRSKRQENPLSSNKKRHRLKKKKDEEKMDDDDDDNNNNNEDDDDDELFGKVKKEDGSEDDDVIEIDGNDDEEEEEEEEDGDEESDEQSDELDDALELLEEEISATEDEDDEGEVESHDDDEEEEDDDDDDDIDIDDSEDEDFMVDDDDDDCIMDYRKKKRKQSSTKENKSKQPLKKAKKQNDEASDEDELFVDENEEQKKSQKRNSKLEELLFSDDDDDEGKDDRHSKKNKSMNKDEEDIMEIVEDDHNAVNSVSKNDVVRKTLSSTVATTSAATTTKKVKENINGDEEVIVDEEDEITEEELPDEIDPFWWIPEEAEALKKSSLTSLQPEELLSMSYKVFVTLSLLAVSVSVNDKMLVFSQSLYVLDLLETFINIPHWYQLLNPNYEMEQSRWTRGFDYLRIDGSISDRQKLIDRFNEDEDVKLMLISTKAGNMGINLQAANRVVIFDCSWNPTYDLQAIFRSFRVGQEKDVFIYRLVSAGTMEEKIYRNQVVKQALAARVVDAQMPNNQFTDKERSELLKFEDEEDEEIEDKKLTEEERGVKESQFNVRNAELQQRFLEVLNTGTVDTVLTRFIANHGTKFFTSFEDHDSFLVDNSESHLNAEEKAIAEQELLKEIEMMRAPPPVLQPKPPMGGATAEYAQLYQQQQLLAASNSRKFAPNVAAANATTTSSSAVAAETSSFSTDEDTWLVVTKDLFPFNFNTVAQVMNLMFKREFNECQNRYYALHRTNRATPIRQSPIYAQNTLKLREWAKIHKMI